MSSCFGLGRKRVQLEDEEAPLIPQYEDDTVLQRRLHQKLHSYQMLRALTQGFMPSNEQLIVNLRTLLASDVLNPDTTDLSDSGRLLAKYAKRWLEQFNTLLAHKNGGDQIQDFVWFLTKARMSVDVADMAAKASKVKARADTAAAYKSLQTVGTLLLTNSDFRVFLSDLQTIGRDVFKDSAFAISQAAENTGKKLEEMPAAPDVGGGEDLIQMEGEGAGDSGKGKLRRGSDILKDELGEKTTTTETTTPETTTATADATVTQDDLEADVTAVAKIVGEEAATVGKATKQSIGEHLSGDEPQALLERLKRAVLRLRQRPDYNDSVSTLSLLIKRYATIYSRAAEHVADTVQEDVAANESVGRAVENFWQLLRSFGDAAQWDELEARLRRLADHQKRNPEFESLMTEVGNALQKLLTDPSSLDSIGDRMQEVRERINDSQTESSLRQDLDGLLEQVPRTLQAVAADRDVHELWATSAHLLATLSPASSPELGSDLLRDCVNVFVPALVQAVQYVPIPRLEVSVPEMDLLLENLILEPGKTVNHSSFLPFRARAETYSEVEVRKTHTLRTVTRMKNLVTLKVDGLSVRGEEVGFWLRARKGIFSLADQGIASFALDERGLDVHVDVEVGRERQEQLLTLRGVRVKIHKLNYALRQSKFSLLAWLFRPLLRPIVRRVMERQLAKALEDFFHAANRELLYARERLRATRIADPQDLLTFLRAIAARLTPEEDPDVYTRVGVEQPGRGVFRGVYAPGSVVKVWNEEAGRASEHIGDEWDRGGWRNAAFDVPTITP